MDPIVTAQYGLFAAQQRFAGAAGVLARAGEPVDLAEAVVEMANAKTALTANAAVMRTADEMLGVVLDISA
jgi:flagellar hook protein FlgE